METYIDIISTAWKRCTWIGRVTWVPILLIGGVVALAIEYILDPFFDWLLTFEFFGRLSGKMSRFGDGFGRKLLNVFFK
jgi:hypothetical protein